MRTFWLWVIACGTLLGTWAHDSRPFVQSSELRQLTSGEFLEALPGIMNAGMAVIEVEPDPYPLINVLELEAQFRLNRSETTDFHQIDAAYQFLRRSWGQVINHRFWNQELLEAYLRTHSRDLNDMRHFIAGNLQVDVARIDFDVDGRDEHLLTVKQPGDALYMDYFVLRRDRDRWIFLDTTLPYAVQDFGNFPSMVHDARENVLEILAIEDLNHDEQPEWLVLSARDDSYSLSGRLKILELEGDKFTDLGSNDLSYLEPSTDPWKIQWEITDPTGDGTRGLLQHRRIYDNWGCEFTETTPFVWDGRQFVKSETSREYPDSDGCIWRQAEQAMWDHDWARAITLYRRLPRTSDLGDRQTWSAPSNYTDVRLATALILSGQMEDGLSLLRSLHSLPASQNSLNEYVDVLLKAYETNPTAIGICMAAYDFIMYNGYYFYHTGFLKVGHANENQIYDQGMYIPAPAHPEWAACPAGYALSKILQDHPFHTDISPEQQLHDLGIRTAYTFPADLNSDGEEEWLIWPAILQQPPILFVPAGLTYIVSRPTVNSFNPNSYNVIDAIRLPGDAGLALVNLDYSEHYEQRHAGNGYGGGPGCPAGRSSRPAQGMRLPGEISLWILKGAELWPIMNAPICSIESLDVLFPDGMSPERLLVWIFDNDRGYVPAAYIWNRVQRSYASPPPFPTQTPLPNAGQNTDPWSLKQEIFRASSTGDFGQVVTLAHEFEALLPEVDSFDVRYLNAVALEALGNSKDSAEAYAEIADDGPAGWRELAALHLAPHN